MKETPPVVFVVDDEPLILAALTRLIRAAGFDVQTFASAQQFLDAARPDALGCLVLDVRLPDANGLDLQHKLTAAHVDLPVIFITGHGDIPMSVRAMKAGAVEFLTKPFKDQDLLDALRDALARNQSARQQRAELARMQARYELLTPREREVFPLVTQGFLNKQIAADLGTSEKTVKIHRAQVMHKMAANSVADLVRMADKLGLTSPKA
jgi:FixJ family two-component response regulator